MMPTLWVLASFLALFIALPSLLLLSWALRPGFAETLLTETSLQALRVSMTTTSVSLAVIIIYHVRDAPCLCAIAQT